MHWDPAEGPLPAGALDGVDAVVNLAGAPIGGEALDGGAQAPDPREPRADHPRRWWTRSPPTTRRACSSTRSGVDIYGAREDAVDEASGPGEGFLPDTAVAWEREALRAADHGVRVVLVRSGLVLARDADALVRMARPVKLFAGGPLGERAAVDTRGSTSTTRSGSSCTRWTTRRSRAR